MPKQTLYQIGGNRENHEFCPLGGKPATLNWQAGPGAGWTTGKRRLESDDGKAAMGMTWRSYLKHKTRQPEFLWRMVLSILAIGIGLGFVAQRVCRPAATQLDATKLEQKIRSDQDRDHLEALAEQEAWAELWWALPKVIYFRSRVPGPIVLSVIAGCCWWIFLWQAMLLPGLGDWRFWCGLLAIPLGLLSIWPTLFWNYWQEQVWNLHDSQELIGGVRYFILSVGLREELAKLLCLLPLMPMLLRIRDELTTLLVAGAVGLGFAIAENIGYFNSTAGTATLGRFLTANPFHITLTALGGLALYRGLQNPKGWGSHALGVVGLLIFAHGLYDAFIVLPALAEYSLLGMIIFALVVYQFFHELRELRPSRNDTISLSANFLCGVSVLTAVTFVYLSATLGMSIAFDMLASSVMSLAVMVYLFLREMPETMVSV